MDYEAQEIQKEVYEVDMQILYREQKQMLNTAFYEMAQLKQNMSHMQSMYNDGQRANSAGMQNVYSKCLEIEKRQIEIEAILNTDRVKYLIDAIPNEEYFNNMIEKINGLPLNKLKNDIAKVRMDLEELVDRFTF